MKIIMIADDSPVIRKVGRRLIEDMGLVVVEAATGHEVIERCRTNMPDAIIIDRDMPGPGSIEIVGEVSRMPTAQNTKIIYCLSEMLIPEMTRAKRAGAAGFIMKPFDKRMLQQKLAEFEMIEDDKGAAA